MKNMSRRQYTRLDWDGWYERARMYYEKNHNLRIPTKSKTEDGLLLGRWIERQRMAYHEKGVYRIDDRKIYLLNQIGMEWALGLRMHWNDWYQYCVQYYEKYQNMDIPRAYMEKELPLGEWISYQRKRYKKNKMKAEEISKLEELGINWQIRKFRSWDEYYEQARCYYSKYGDLEVPSGYITENGIKLGVWIIIQRERYIGMRKSKLNESEVQQLNQIGMRWKGKRAEVFK